MAGRLPTVPRWTYLGQVAEVAKTFGIWKFKVNIRPAVPKVLATSATAISLAEE